MSASIGGLLEAFEGGVAGRRREDPLAAAFDRGRAEGLTEGVLAGRAQGREEGRAEGLEAGREEGLRAGRAEGRASAAEDRDAAVAAIAEALKSLEQEKGAAERRLAASAARVLRAAVSALLPRLARRGLADEVADLAGDICAGAAIGGAVLRVAPEQEEAARAALNLQAGAAVRTLEIAVDPALGEAGARLEWNDGFMEFDAERTAEQVIERLDAALANAIEAAQPGDRPAQSGAEGLV